MPVVAREYGDVALVGLSKEVAPFVVARRALVGSPVRVLLEALLRLGLVLQGLLIGLPDGAEGCVRKLAGCVPPFVRVQELASELVRPLQLCANCRVHGS